jgi:hypothetical protein
MRARAPGGVAVDPEREAHIRVSSTLRARR